MMGLVDSLGDSEVTLSHRAVERGLAIKKYVHERRFEVKSGRYIDTPYPKDPMGDIFYIPLDEIDRIAGKELDELYEQLTINKPSSTSLRIAIMNFINAIDNWNVARDGQSVKSWVDSNGGGRGGFRSNNKPKPDQIRQ